MCMCSVSPQAYLTIDINFIVLCLCGQIVQAREQQLNQSANELKLSLVQQRFPNENLNLDQSIEIIEVWEYVCVSVKTKIFL